MKDADRQFRLWREGEWHLGILGGPQSPSYDKCMAAVSVVDLAIKKMIWTEI